MSRSYKKSPIYKDSTLKGPTYKSGKQIANRIVRRKSICGGRGAYKRLVCSYDISDYKFRVTEEQFRKEWENNEYGIRDRFGSYRRAYLYWKKYYRLK